MTDRVGRRLWLARWRGLDAVARVQRRVPAGAVALTFDDGPHPSSTPAVLDALAALQVPATFFCVGRNAVAHPDLVRRMRAAGHAVGSHSATHPDPSRLHLAAAAREYRRGQQALGAVLGEPVHLFRPPHGHLGPTTAAWLRRSGLAPWLWTVDPRDWCPGATAESIADVAGSAVSGDVVLLHDWVEEPQTPSATDRSATVAALPELVGRIRARGLALVPLPGWSP